MAESKLSTSEQVATIWDLGGLTRRQLGKKVWRGIDEDDLVGRAAELAFNFILALFPLLLFLLALFGLFDSRATTLHSDLLTYLSQVLPPAAFQVVSRTLAEVTANAGGGKITFGIVLTLWFASGGMVSMFSGLNGVYEVKEGRSWVKVRLTAIVLTAAISVLILSALGAVLTGGYVANLLGSYYGLQAAAVIAWRVGGTVVALVFVTVSFSVIYYYGPDLKEQHWYWITPGSVVGVLVWVAATFAFRGYLHFFNTYSRTYGSLGAAMILLMWLYITGFAFLVGGEINAQIEHAAGRRGHPEAKEPGEKAAA
ncbi:MAG: YihY/virulence factor BrkB family protein [Acidobacteria bacterium]|nr:YihY/virulence factor BrkB family protein [Acidobacteriota bacterium]MBV9626303.1 YihY/virulence factor BrkB family protein [Acidobacteriota bacterium]